ncbi:MAG: hypothetical protein LUH02_09625 [Erysipelotrichaceae bacterium]|nr:hypothetical protein [Erysipelotrichaceae bacterium]
MPVSLDKMDKMLADFIDSQNKEEKKTEQTEETKQTIKTKKQTHTKTQSTHQLIYKDPQNNQVKPIYQTTAISSIPLEKNQTSLNTKHTISVLSQTMMRIPWGWVIIGSIVILIIFNLDFIFSLIATLVGGVIGIIINIFIFYIIFRAIVYFIRGY